MQGRALRWRGPLVLVLLFCACAAVGDYWSRGLAGGTNHAPDSVRWDDGPDAAGLVRSATRPTLVRGAWVASIPALQWTAERLSRAAPLAPVEVRQQTGRAHFSYVTPHRAGPSEWSAAIQRTLRNVTMDALLFSRKPGVHRYLSRKLDALFPQLVGDFPFAELHVASEHYRDPIRAHVWLGSGRGIVTAAHYDLQHNFFLQVIGEKTFTLLGPEELERVRLFPFTSLFARQCAVDYEDVVPVHADVARDFVRVSHVTVTLGPGDMLYLPPYWVHRVVTESAVSVSVNAWSDVLEAYQLDSQLMQLPLPLDPHWGWSARIAATRTWLRDHVYSKVATLLRMEWDVFVPRHLRNRWALVPLMPCQADVDVGSDPAHELDPVKAAAYAEPVVAIFRAMAVGHVARASVLQVLVANYCEMAIQAVVGLNCTGHAVAQL